MMCMPTTANPGFYRSHATVKGETAANSTLSFPKLRHRVPLAAKNVQVSCMNRIYTGFGFRNDNGGMEFYSEDSKQRLAETTEELIEQLRSHLSDLKTKLSEEQTIYDEGSEHIDEWTTDLHAKEAEFSRLNADLQQLIEQGKAGAIEETERERQRYILRKDITDMKSKVSQVKRKIDTYKASYCKILQIESLIGELESEIADKEKQKTTLSTFTVEKNGILTFPMVKNRRQKAVCVFANILDYLSYVVIVYETGYDEFPKNCDCIVLNDSANFMKMLVSVDTYDYIFCFFPDTILHKSLEETIIQRDAPRAVSMGRHFCGHISLYDYLMSFGDDDEPNENDK